MKTCILPAWTVWGIIAMYDKLQQIIALRKQAEHLAFFQLADELRFLELEMKFRLGIHNALDDMGRAKRTD